MNGVQIDVAADDTLNAVLARITTSGAGVDAAFDVGTESVVLTQRTPGSVAQVVLGNDSSGFLAATKLTGASEVPGQDGADPIHEAIASVPALVGVADGFFTVNGVAISVDTASDSLGDVLDRINGSVPEVRATLDPATRRVEIAAQDGAPILSLENGSSGFLSALRIVEGTYHPLAAREAQAGSEPGYLRLDRALSRSFDDVHAFLFADDLEGPQGLIPVLIERVQTLQQLVGASPGRTSTGYFLDLQV